MPPSPTTSSLTSRYMHMYYMYEHTAFGTMGKLCTQWVSPLPVSVAMPRSNSGSSIVYVVNLRPAFYQLRTQPYMV